MGFYFWKNYFFLVGANCSLSELGLFLGFNVLDNQFLLVKTIMNKV